MQLLQNYHLDAHPNPSKCTNNQDCNNRRSSCLFRLVLLLFFFFPSVVESTNT